MTLNNIKVDHSVVGAINTGDVASIDVSITYLKQAGNKDVSVALTELTEAIVNATAMAKPDQSAMLDQVAYLSEQAAAAAKDRRPGVISATFNAIGKMATTITAVSAAWNVAEPILKAHFGFP